MSNGKKNHDFASPSFTYWDMSSTSVAWAFSATVREAQKVERRRFAVATGSPISFRIAAELDDPRFVGMQVQPELREALAQFCQKLLCLRTILKADDEVIR